MKPIRRPRPSVSDYYMVSLYTEAMAEVIVGKTASRQTLVKPPTWIAAQLNRELQRCLKLVGYKRMSPPSEQARFAKRIHKAASECLALLAPDAGDDMPPERVAMDIYTTLLGDGNFRPFNEHQLQAVSCKETWEMLDRAAIFLWLVQRSARIAQEKWRAQILPRHKRHGADGVRLEWLCGLGRVYSAAFDTQPPASARSGEQSPFSRFCEAVRAPLISHDWGTPDPDSALDEVLRQVKFLTGNALISFIGKNGPLIRSGLDAELPMWIKRDYALN